jgi:N-acetylglucosamine kinase-like BadF-type ATPase
MGYALSNFDMTVIGIDAGGTRTVCQLADASGLVLAEVRGPGANLQSQGEHEVESILGTLMSRARGDRAWPQVIAVGMAGADRPGDVDLVRALLARLGHRGRSVVVNDALVALEAGLPGEPGAIVIAGTGSIAYGRNAAGQAARAGGWGYILGDEGSGYWLGRQALRSVVRASDGRGPMTALTPRVLSHYGVSRAQDLVHEIADTAARPSAIASLARDVGEAAAGGDLVARHLLSEAARELAGAGESVVRRLGLRDAKVLLAGGTLLGVDALRREVLSEIARRIPNARAESLQVEPALGAVRLAADELAGRLALPVYID